MFARSVSIRLKANSSAAFTKQIENEVVPMLRKQPGFEGELTFLASGGADAVALSFWNNKESADAYARNGYPDVLGTLSKVVEGTPKVQTYEVINSTLHKIAATVTA